MESKKPTISAPNYFDNPNDQQTPSNTPNNKKLGGGGLNFDMSKMDFSRNKHKYSDDEDDEKQIKMINKKPIIPIAYYFDNPNDQQTPSHTPNNKKLGGGGLNFNMSNMDFSKNKHKYSDDEDE